MIAITACIVITAMVAAFLAGTAMVPNPSQQNEAWRQEGMAARRSYMEARDCPYTFDRQANPTAYTFWRAGFVDQLRDSNP